jgi:hypothetical protein
VDAITNDGLFNLGVTPPSTKLSTATTVEPVSLVALKSLIKAVDKLVDDEADNTDYAKVYRELTEKRAALVLDEAPTIPQPLPIEHVTDDEIDVPKNDDDEAYGLFHEELEEIKVELPKNAWVKWKSYKTNIGPEQQQGDTLTGLLKSSITDVTNVFMTQRSYDHFIRNTAARFLALSGPDFMSNAWDIAILVAPNKSQYLEFFSEYKSLPIPQQQAAADREDAGIFMVRAASIKVPQPKSETYETPFLTTKIKKLRTKVAMDHKAELEFLLDDKLHFIDIFQLLSGTNMTIETLGTRESEKLTEREKLLLNAPWANAITGTPVDVSNIEHTYSIIVRHQKLITPDKDSLSGGGYKRSSEEPEANKQMYWLFRDVKFLGVSSDITFTRDDANTQNVIAPFIFKVVHRVDPQELQSKEMTTSNTPSTMTSTVLDGILPQLRSQSASAWHEPPDDDEEEDES